MNVLHYNRITVCVFSTILCKSFLISLLSSDDKKQRMFPSIFGNFNKTIGEEGFEKLNVFGGIVLQEIYYFCRKGMLFKTQQYYLTFRLL